VFKLQKRTQKHHDRFIKVVYISMYRKSSEVKR